MYSVRMEWDECEVRVFLDDLNKLAWQFVISMSVIVGTTIYLSVSSLK